MFGKKPYDSDMVLKEAKNGSGRTACVLLALIVALIYSNTFEAAWHLDDYPNILHNERIHLTHPDRDGVAGIFFAKPGNPAIVYRPVAMLSLALNWRFGQDRVWGYHLVNTGIHMLAAFFLFLTMQGLYRSPALGHRSRQEAFFVSLLGSVLWAAHPIQTQAVTYIVQRMASQAGLFYLVGLYGYVQGRLAPAGKRRCGYYMLSLLGFLLAVGSKENALLMPLALFLVEIVFFQDMRLPRVRRKWTGLVMLAAAVLVMVAVIGFFDGRPLNFLNGYANRPFTAFERLVSAPRILFLYLFQIAYPVPQQFSLVHDFQHSTSMLEPWTTLPALIGVGGLIFFAIRSIAAYPLVSFGVLFFFLNHVVESTILPLELVFEHRNYLPTMFLFFPLAAGLMGMMDYYKKRRSVVYGLMLVSVPAGCILLGAGTYARNSDWSTRETMLADILGKAPDNIRTRRALAQFLMDRGKPAAALAVYRKVLRRSGYHSKYSKASTLNNMGNIYQQLGRYADALSCYEQVLRLYPHYQTAYYNMILAYIRMGAWDAASQTADTLLSKADNHEDYLNIKGVALIRQERYREAVDWFRKALQLAPGHPKILVNLGFALGRYGRYDAAERVLQQVSQPESTAAVALFCQVENQLRAGRPAGAARYAGKLTALFSMAEIQQQLVAIRENNLSVPVSCRLVEPFMMNQAAGMLKGIVDRRE